MNCNQNLGDFSGEGKPPDPEGSKGNRQQIQDKTAKQHLDRQAEKWTDKRTIWSPMAWSTEIYKHESVQ